MISTIFHLGLTFVYYYVLGWWGLLIGAIAVSLILAAREGG